MLACSSGNMVECWILMTVAAGSSDTVLQSQDAEKSCYWHLPHTGASLDAEDRVSWQLGYDRWSWCLHPPESGCWQLRHYIWGWVLSGVWLLAVLASELRLLGSSEEWLLEAQTEYCTMGSRRLWLLEAETCWLMLVFAVADHEYPQEQLLLIFQQLHTIT